MRPKAIVEYGDVKLTVIEANGRAGMERGILQYKGEEAIKAAPDQPDVLRIWQRVTYPDLIPAVKEAEGTLTVYDDNDQEITVDFAVWPVPLEQCMLLPDKLINAWEAAVYQMNPHWHPGADEGSKEKKEQSSPAGSAIT